MARRNPVGDVFKTSNKKVKPTNKKQKLRPEKVTPEISTLQSFGIKVLDQKVAVKIFEQIAQESKKSGKPFVFVAKEFSKNYNKK